MISIHEQTKGRWTSILSMLGIEEQHLNGKHQACIFGHGKDCSRFDRNSEYYYCNQCGHKSALDLAMEFLGLSFKETCEEIRQMLGESKMNAPIKKADPLPRLKQIHKGLLQVKRGDVVARYLRSRGIAKRGDDIFTHKNVPYYGGFVDGKKVDGVFNAMVSRVTNSAGELETYHITYLTDEGKKIDFAPAKIIVTPRTTITGNSVKLGKAGEHLCVAEGVETALMIMQEEGVTCWSALNANGLIKIEVPEHVKLVSVFVDNDKNCTGQIAAWKLTKRLREEGFEVNVICDWGIGEDYLDWANRTVIKSREAA
jgi:putative DNA primase/helicase